MRQKQDWPIEDVRAIARLAWENNDLTTAKTVVSIMANLSSDSDRLLVANFEPDEAEALGHKLIQLASRVRELRSKDF